MRIAVIPLLITAACVHRPTEPSCAGPAWADLTTTRATSSAIAPPTDPASPDTIIARVEVRGVDPALAASLHAVLETRPGMRLGDAPLRHDLAALWAVGVVERASVELDGDAIAFVVTPPPIVGRVVAGDRDDLARLRWLIGTPLQPARVQRMSAAIQRALVADGHLDAHVHVRRAPGAAGAVDLCVVATVGPRVTVGAITFPGAHAMRASELIAAFPRGQRVDRPGGLYDEDALGTDLLYVSSAYWERGMLNVKVGEPALIRHGSRLDIAVPIEEGPVFSLGAITRPLGFPAPPQLATGALAARGKIAAARDTLQTLVGDGATVIPLTKVDLPHRRIDLEFEVDWRSPWDALAFWRSRLF